MNKIKTPQGDGNLTLSCNNCKSVFIIINEQKKNPKRGRQHDFTSFSWCYIVNHFMNKIKTPQGDGNFPVPIAALVKLSGSPMNKRKTLQGDDNLYLPKFVINPFNINEQNKNLTRGR